MVRSSRLQPRYYKGDTIIEVIFAFAVFSLVTVGAYSIMNQGTAIAQRALEITLVREQINGQAEALRYLHDAYVNSSTAVNANINGSAAEKWKYISSYTTTSTQANESCEFSGNVNFNRSFVINPDNLAIVTSSPVLPSTYSRVNGSSQPQGLWVQAIRNNGGSGNVDYFDFYIRACWQSTGQAMPVTLETIVRLYEPN